MHPNPNNSAVRRICWLVFITTFVSFGYFHPGSDGGNASRFAMTRAMVEEGRFTIDSYLVCFPMRPPNSTTRLHRVPVVNGEYEANGYRFVLCWTQPPLWRLNPFSDNVTPGAAPVDLLQAGTTLDVSFYGGHFHPNKAPGTSFLAVPAYFLLYHTERLLGLDPDEWWVLTVNAWLTSVFSVGLISALGCVVFFRIALKWSANDLKAALLATCTLAFGTNYFSYATTLYEFNIAGASLLGSFFFLMSARDREVAEKTDSLAIGQPVGLVWLSGVTAGVAAISNYIAALAVPLMGFYLIATLEKKGLMKWFILGLVPPLVLICAYNYLCFDTPFTTNYRNQNPFMLSNDLWYGIFGFRLDSLVITLISPNRGVFFYFPVLIMAVAAIVAMWRAKPHKIAALVVCGVAGIYLCFCTLYVGSIGGFGVATRYLVPAIPFVSLALVFAYQKWFKLTLVLACYSIAVGLLITAVNPFSPLGVHPMATLENRPQWAHNHLTQYLLPMFLQGKPEPLIRDQVEQMVQIASRQETLEAFSPEVRRAREQAIREQLLADIPRLKHEWYAVFIGEPVSANQRGVYEMWPYLCYGVGSKQAHWNSFNVGEFFFPSSKWSLAPLLALWAALIGWAFLVARRARNFFSDNDARPPQSF